MRRAVVTGLGFITSIGNNRAEVLANLRAARTGIERFAELERHDAPVHLAGTIKGFHFPRPQPESWIMPAGPEIPRQQLRSLSPHALFAHFAMREAIADAGLTPERVSNPRTGMFCASEGSPWLFCEHTPGCSARGWRGRVPSSWRRGLRARSTTTYVPHYRILGASGGFVSACAASAHAFGAALDLIRLGRQDVMFVVGAEDCDPHSILRWPLAAPPPARPTRR